MTRVFSAIFLIILLPAAKAHSCDLHSVVDGTCPAVTSVLGDESSFDRAAIVKKFAWTTLAEFKGPGQKDLRICFFTSKGPIVNESNRLFKKIDFSKNQNGWRRLAALVESQASRWNVPQISALGTVRTSRLKFVFRNVDNGFRTCEDYPKSHVRIAFVENAKTTVYGTEAVRNRLNNHGAVQASMALAVSEVRADNGAVLHEFGHALGFIHETHHPRWASCADMFDLQKYLADHPNLYPSAKSETQEKEMARENMLESEFGDKQLASTYTFDPKSIMTYIVETKYFPDDKSDCAFPDDIRSLSDGDYEKYLDVYAME